VRPINLTQSRENKGQCLDNFSLQTKRYRVGLETLDQVLGQENQSLRGDSGDDLLFPGKKNVEECKLAQAYKWLVCVLSCFDLVHLPP
jgi:hypothetical protein